MNQPSTPTTPAAAATQAQPSPPTPTTLEERAHNVLKEIQGEKTPASEASDVGLGNPPTVEASPEASGAELTAEQKREARKKRLEELAAKDREAVDRKERQAAAEKAQRELERMAKELAEAKAQNDGKFDPKKLDAPTFFKIAEDAGLDPAAIGKWLSEATQNPAKLAEENAKKAIDPELKALREQVEALKSELNGDRSTRQKAAQEAQELQSANEFIAHTAKNASDAPLSAAFLNQHGPEEFYRLALGASQRIPEGAGWTALLDRIEDDLSSLAPLFAQSGQPSRDAAPPQPRAAAKANGLTNSLAAQRASVVDGEDWSSLSLDERAARLIRDLG